MIRLSISSGLLRVDFTRGPLIPEGDGDMTAYATARKAACVLDCKAIGGWHPSIEPCAGFSADTRNPERCFNCFHDAACHSRPVTPPATWCACELHGDRPHCSEFRPSILHDDLCIDCYHAKGCHT